MCGIVGYIDQDNRRCAASMHELVGAMADRVAHRGPDDRGTWVDPDSGIALGHRRLSIIDLSPAGSQPMVSGSGRFVIVFNGEVYNYLEILEKLKTEWGADVNLRGHSDTEIVAAAFDRWGVEHSLPRLTGMFAMAVWDRQERLLWLVRDRFGKKPLYYGRFGSAMLFASELKAFYPHPSFRREIDHDAIASYLRFNCIPSPRSVFCGVKKLPAASWLRISLLGRDQDPHTYWSLEDLVRASLSSPFEGSDEEATEGLDRCLRSAVRQRLLASDVQVGLFLSGGVDSSTVAALAQAQSSIPIHTFSIGMSSSHYDESKYARAVARHLGTDHTEWELTAPEAMGVIPEMPETYDEPFADASQIPTLLVSRLAKRYVKVVLSGDGGDEMFGGYNRHVLAAAMWPALANIPAALRRCAAKGIGLIAPQRWEDLVQRAGPAVPSHFRLAYLSDKMHKISLGLQASDSQDLYLRLISNFEESSAIVSHGNEDGGIPAGAEHWLSDQRPAESMMMADACFYMHDDILVKVDRASMAASLEVRSPFLDVDVVEFAWKLPLRFKIRDGVGKWVVRRVMSRYIPASITDHPKMGFAVPLADWLRGPLREWAESMLNPIHVSNDGLVSSGVVRTQWANFLAGRNNLTDNVWCLLMLQGWMESQRSSAQLGCVKAV
jgi:asparagine synthase (glutamine-hydrolysing)